MRGRDMWTVGSQHCFCLGTQEILSSRNCQLLIQRLVWIKVLFLSTLCVASLSSQYSYHGPPCARSALSLASFTPELFHHYGRACGGKRKYLWRAWWWREAMTCGRMMSSLGKFPRAWHCGVISLVLIGGCTSPFSSPLEGIIYDLDITLLLMCWHFRSNNF